VWGKYTTNTIQYGVGGAAAGGCTPRAPCDACLAAVIPPWLYVVEESWEVLPGVAQVASPGTLLVSQEGGTRRAAKALGVMSCCLLALLDMAGGELPSEFAELKRRSALPGDGVDVRDTRPEVFTVVSAPLGEDVPSVAGSDLSGVT